MPSAPTPTYELPPRAVERLSERAFACVERLRLHRAEASDLSTVPISQLAAVLVLLYERPAPPPPGAIEDGEGGGAPVGSGELRVVLTTRSKFLNSHPGQTALPGGRTDDTDADFVETAYREAYEEIGLPMDSPDVHTLCVLRPFLSLMRLLVTPVVALLSDPTMLDRLRASPGEVECIFDHPLEAILDTEMAAKEDLVPIGDPENWPYEVEFHSTADSELRWLDGSAYRMHRFRSTASPIKGLTSDILIMAAQIAYDRPPSYPRYAPGQAIGFQATWQALHASEGQAAGRET